MGGTKLTGEFGALAKSKLSFDIASIKRGRYMLP